jgi:recombination protein RecT
MSNLAVIQKDIESELVAAGVESVLPESVKMQTFVRCAAVAMASNKDLANADRDSVIMSLTQCAKDGLVPDSKEAAIVTFNTNVAAKGQSKQWITKAQYMPMIDGVMKRARMSGQIAVLSSKAVFNDDVFRYWMDENGEHINYEPAYQGGDMRLAFAFAKLTNGELIVEVMSRADVDKVRAASKTGQYGPWKDWYDRMACKAVMHRLARRLPNASEIIEMCEAGMNMAFDPSTEKEIFTPVFNNPIDRLKELLSDKDPKKYLPWLQVKSIDDMTEENATAAALKLENAKQ